MINPQRMAALKAVAELGATQQRQRLLKHDANVEALELRRGELGVLAAGYRRPTSKDTSVAMLEQRLRFSAGLVKRFDSVDKHIETVREERVHIEQGLRAALLKCESIKMLTCRAHEQQQIEQRRRDYLADPIATPSRVRGL